MHYGADGVITWIHQAVKECGDDGERFVNALDDRNYERSEIFTRSHDPEFSLCKNCERGRYVMYGKKSKRRNALYTLADG